MLVLNIWEGSDKWSLMNGSNVYGHAAMTIPAQGSATEACYISWWPGGENSTQVKDGKGKSTDRDKDRSFNEDLFAENNHRYLGQLVFTLPLSVGADLDEFWSTSRRQAAGSTIFPKDIQDMFGSKGHPVGDKTLLGALVPNEHWVLDDPEAKKAYLVYKGKKELKVTALEGHRFLFELETKDPIDWIPDQKTRIAKTFPPSLAALLKQKVSALVIDPDAYVGRMSADQVFVSTKKSDGYVSVTPGTGGKKVIRYYHWTRQNLAPTANIEIPTISDGGKGLDDIAIRRWWNIFNAQDHPKWSTFERNCSVIVMIALKIGGASKFAIPHVDASWLCWTPSDIKKYGEAIQKGVESGGVKPKPVPNAKPIPNLDLGTGTIVWTKKQFEKASKLKGIVDVRSGALKKIDTQLDTYHAIPRKDGGTFEKRADALGALLETVAEFTASKPDTKRAASIFTLAERAVFEREVMIREAKTWNAEAKERYKTMARDAGLDIDIDSLLS